MYARIKEQSPRRERNGLVFHILLQRGNLPDVGLTATWVEATPASSHRSNEHTSEQVYVITAGRGRRWVEEEEREISPGRPCLHPSRRRYGERDAS